MPVFHYKAKKMSGQEIEGRREARDRFELAEFLRKEDYYLLFSKAEKTSGVKLKFFSFFGHISAEEKIVFARNLAVMVGAGVSLVKGFDILSRQTDNRSWKKILENIGQAVKTGRTLNQALENYPQIFKPLFRSMVKAGEISGKLEEALKLIAGQLESDYSLKRKIQGALVYPAIILSTMIVIGILMFIYVVPTILATFEELEVKLPPTTLVMVKISRFFIEQSFLAAGLTVLIILSAGFLIRSRPGTKLISKILIRAPVISGIVKKMNSARTSRTLSSLISSGVNIVEALEITEEVVQNSAYQKVLRQARAEIQRGNPISKTFISYCDVYPVLVGEMMAIGEETGKLSEMLLRLAVFYEDDVAEAAKTLSTIIEPVLMVLVGAIVGFFAVSMIQPLYSAVGGL
jgi:type IV pilus assembly protein PilC